MLTLLKKSNSNLIMSHEHLLSIASLSFFFYGYDYSNSHYFYCHFWYLLTTCRWFINLKEIITLQPWPLERLLINHYIRVIKSPMTVYINRYQQSILYDRVPACVKLPFPVCHRTQYKEQQKQHSPLASQV